MTAIRWTARITSLLWASFWVWFGLASGLGEGGGPVAVALHTAVPGLVFLAMAAMAWKREIAGGYALLGVGLIVAAGYPILFISRLPISAVLMTDAMLALPPLLSGALFIAAGKKKKAEGIPPLAMNEKGTP